MAPVSAVACFFIWRFYMIALNDYLYDGDTVVKILHRYSSDLKTSALASGNGIDLAHSNCLLQMIELLEHNDFLAG